MIGAGMAFVWFAIVSGALVVCAQLERRNRLAPLRNRPEWQPPRADWGFDRKLAPVSYVFGRALAGGARLVRSRTILTDRSKSLCVLGRIVSCVAVASALSLVPFAGTWGGTKSGVALVVVDLEHGLIALVFLIFLMVMGQVVIGLSDRNDWSRLGSVRLASRGLGGLGLLALVLIPLAIGSGSFRLHELVFVQQETLAPLSWLPAQLSGTAFEAVRSWRWLGWNLFIQPLTALLFVFTLMSLTRRPWAYDAVAGGIGAAGFGLDNEPVDFYWGRLEARLARVLSASLFVSLFLGAGAIPFVSASAVVSLLAPFVGLELPSLLGVSIQIGAFVAKLMGVLAVASFLRRATATLRDDQWIDMVSSRLFPLAWANLLLVSAISLLSKPSLGGV
jgi:NADH:ubiquinone oxidoreductase subunit H